MLLFATTVFLSAFLLFQVQPIVAKMILPWFGGSSSVWTLCMVFFQVELLLGYAYVHWVHEKLSPQRQPWVHGALLLLSLATLPIVADPTWKLSAQAAPTWSVLGVLATTVGVPYLLLSTTGPLMQAWFARSFVERGQQTYRQQHGSTTYLRHYRITDQAGFVGRFPARDELNDVGRN